MIPSPTARGRSRLVALVAVLGAVLGAAGVWGADAARADPPLWRVQRGGAVVTMFGSVHLLSKGVAWKTPAMERALKAADQVWFEIPIDPAAQAQAVQEAARLGALAPGQTLSARLPPALWTRVTRLAQGEGLAPAALDRMQPWLVELLLSTVYFQKDGAAASLGVEAQIAADAPPTAAREAFETVSEQLHLFADDPFDDQVASLTQTLDEIADDPGLFDRLVGEWVRGDVPALVKGVIVPMWRETPGVYARLLVARNRRFAARIEEMLRQPGGREFVVVGVGHLIGPQGVPALLRRDGFSVEGP